MEEELIRHGICFMPPINSSKPVHAPISLTPTPFSSSAFNRAVELQPDFNLLILRTVQNAPLLKTVCSKLAEGDQFVSNLFKIYLKYPEIPKLFFNVNRSDYMVEGDRIFQIELNTISASLAGLSTKLTEFQMKKFPSANIPNNSACYRIGESFNLAVKLYEEEYCTKGTKILFIVQEDERNLFDQIHLQNSIESDSLILRKSLSDSKAFNLQNEVLRVDGHEISLIYFRAGYSPLEYLSNDHWVSREILESSRSIKCPDIGSHLAGLKKIQQVLTSPNLLLSTLKNDMRICDNLLSTFAGIYNLDESEEGTRNTLMAIDNPNKFVLKPQREGGGNNTYGEDVRNVLMRLTPSERSTFILMDRINPSINKIKIFRNNLITEIDSISELGIYGVILQKGDEIVLNEQAGWLLRTKPAESDEGGVVSGYSVIDVPDLK